MARSHLGSTNVPRATEPGDGADLLAALGLSFPVPAAADPGYHRAMTTTSASAQPTGPDGPASGTGLTAADAIRVAAAATAAYAPSTRHVYASCWRQWARWCQHRDLTPLPADPAAVCAYLTERAEIGRCYGTIDQDCCAIAHQHREHGLPDPISHDAVRRIRRGLRRTLGTAPRRLAHPLSPAEIRQIIAGIDRTAPAGARDAALILLGYAGALRSCELAALDLTDLDLQPAGLLLRIARSKTDPDAHGQIVPVARGQHADTDPLVALDRWLARRGRTPGPLFTRVQGSHITLESISANRIARLLHQRAQAAGLNAERITGHSLRAGHATTAALNGVGLARLAAQTRHKDLTVLLDRYIRPAQALHLTSSRDLGL